MEKAEECCSSHVHELLCVASFRNQSRASKSASLVSSAWWFTSVPVVLPVDSLYILLFISGKQIFLLNDVKAFAWHDGNLWVVTPRLLPQGPWNLCIAGGEEGRAVFADRTEWTRLPGDRRYLCICQHFSIKIRRVTEVWGWEYGRNSKLKHSHQSSACLRWGVEDGPQLPVIARNLT